MTVENKVVAVGFFAVGDQPAVCESFPCSPTTPCPMCVDTDESFQGPELCYRCNDYIYYSLGPLQEKWLEELAEEILEAEANLR